MRYSTISSLLFLAVSPLGVLARPVDPNDLAGQWDPSGQYRKGQWQHGVFVPNNGDDRYSQKGQTNQHGQLEKDGQWGDNNNQNGQYNQNGQQNSQNGWIDGNGQWHSNNQNIQNGQEGWLDANGQFHANDQNGQNNNNQNGWTDANGQWHSTQKRQELYR
ncbi:hypothetical protein PEX1_096800 [Penicillium expansum]|uniref:Uncharacterized protein n=1 Tax=Penicillium expansum TaxID=27334 RepID=A0A0A2J2Y0_PENEN|nr:hypothetical protein PEX2_090870 [Penicillium expansum]KGO47594.1 hypothetical protein PEXP_014810 [Penicillium expansum]KGO49654.1 hypothetical protein PEX1_096800 [Penicillium expansum]KGO54834.1 hypothetical protein PEX2_090870 [Penicillium expansum]